MAGTETETENIYRDTQHALECMFWGMEEAVTLEFSSYMIRLDGREVEAEGLRELYIDVEVDTITYLKNRVEYDSEMHRLYRKFKKESSEVSDYSSHYSDVLAFIEWLRIEEVEFDPEEVTGWSGVWTWYQETEDNTHNMDCVLKEDFQYVVLGTQEHYGPTWIFIQAHLGGDARANYTEGIPFLLEYDGGCGEMFGDWANCVTVTCEGAREDISSEQLALAQTFESMRQAPRHTWRMENWNLEPEPEVVAGVDGQEGTWIQLPEPDKDLRAYKAKEFDFYNETGLEELQEVWEKGVVLVEASDKTGYCPVCGGKLIANMW